MSTTSIRPTVVARSIAAGSGRDAGRAERSPWATAGPIVRGLLCVYAALAAWLPTGEWPIDTRIVLVVFALATAAWTVTRMDDTVVALAASLLLVLTGILPSSEFFAALGDPVVWLLVGACMLAAGVTASGLTDRATARIVGGAGSVRGVMHRVTFALFLSAFAVPSTSGRAALAVPVFATLGRACDSRRLQVGLSLLFPAVILLTAVASLMGAGAHLVTAELLRVATGVEVSFLWWALLGVPVAVVCAHLAAEVVLWTVLRGDDRRMPVADVVAAVRRPAEPLSGAEWRALLLLGGVIALWLTEPLHGLHPALVAVLGGLLAIAPGTGTTTAKQAMDQVPWSLLLFLATTLALGVAFVDTGAASRLADAALAPLAGVDPTIVLGVIVALSAIAHLFVQSRSARSSVLVPIVLALAVPAGLNPVSAALASTAAAGFCLTLTSSAKPVALFARVDEVATFDRAGLLRFAAVMAPLTVGVIVAAALGLWPLLGVPVLAP